MTGKIQPRPPAKTERNSYMLSADALHNMKQIKATRGYARDKDAILWALHFARTRADMGLTVNRADQPKDNRISLRLEDTAVDDLEWLRQHYGFRYAQDALDFALAFTRAAEQSPS